MTDLVQKNFGVIQSIIRTAEERIEHHTGMNLKLCLVEDMTAEPNIDDADIDTCVAKLINDCCRTWGVHSDYVFVKERKKVRVEMRMIIVHIIRLNYPKLTLNKIGSFFKQDHTTVSTNLLVIKGRIEIQDDLTMQLFNKVKHLIDEKVQN